MARFENLKKSEIKKAETFANKFLGTDDCKVTGWGGCIEPADMGWVTIRCEICHNYDERADIDVILNIPLWDRRRTFASKAY